MSNTGTHYELLKLPDKAESEIGAASSGRSKKAQSEYISEIAKVFSNARKSMTKDAVAVIVVHDKNKLYWIYLKGAGSRLRKCLREK